jgi:hypothetical protein
MNWKRITQAILLSSSVILGTGTIATAQDPSWYYRNDKSAVKRHQKEEQRELKRHQQFEREEFGKSSDLRRHQKEEQRELKRHQKHEKRGFDSRDRWQRP